MSLLASPNHWESWEIKWTLSSFHQEKINERESHEVLIILFFSLSSPLSFWLVLSKWSGSMFVVQPAFFSAQKWESHVCPMPRNNCDNPSWIEEWAGLSRLAGKVYLNCTYSTVRQFNPFSTLLYFTWLLLHLLQSFSVHQNHQVYLSLLSNFFFLKIRVNLFVITKAIIFF